MIACVPGWSMSLGTRSCLRNGFLSSAPWRNLPPTAWPSQTTGVTPQTSAPPPNKWETSLYWTDQRLDKNTGIWLYLKAKKKMFFSQALLNKVQFCLTNYVLFALLKRNNWIFYFRFEIEKKNEKISLKRIIPLFKSCNEIDKTNK